MQNHGDKTRPADGVAISALLPEADIAEREQDVRFVPIADITPIIRSPRPQLHAESVGLQAQVLWRF
jgi:hypothetical protein